jgi:hypothetical protein
MGIIKTVWMHVALSRQTINLNLDSWTSDNVQFHQQSSFFLTNLATAALTSKSSNQTFKTLKNRFCSLPSLDARILGVADHHMFHHSLF